MGFKQIPRIPVGASAKRSGARINPSCTPPIYRPLPALPLSRLIYETSLSAFAGSSAISINLLNRIMDTSL